jgi:hypothetical protein
MERRKFVGAASAAALASPQRRRVVTAARAVCHVASAVAIVVAVAKRVLETIVGDLALGRLSAAARWASPPTAMTMMSGDRGDVVLSVVRLSNVRRRHCNYHRPRHPTNESGSSCCNLVVRSAAPPSIDAAVVGGPIGRPSCGGGGPTMRDPLELVSVASVFNQSTILKSQASFRNDRFTKTNRRTSADLAAAVAAMPSLSTANGLARQTSQDTLTGQCTGYEIDSVVHDDVISCSSFASNRFHLKRQSTGIHCEEPLKMSCTVNLWNN